MRLLMEENCIRDGYHTYYLHYYLLPPSNLAQLRAPILFEAACTSNSSLQEQVGYAVEFSILVLVPELGNAKRLWERLC
mgnify:CR=1 FL=1